MRRLKSLPAAKRSARARPVEVLAWATLCLGLHGLSQPASAEWFGSVEVGVLHDDNLSRSELGADVESDRGLRLFAEGGRSFQLEAGHSLGFVGSLEYSAFDEHQGMDNLVAGLSGTWRRRFGLGPLAPSLGALVAVQRLEFDDAKRDGWFYLGEIRWLKRLSALWDFEAAGSYEARRADATHPGTVFDQDRFGASMLANLTLGSRWVLTTGYDYLHGDVDSNATPNDRIIAAKRASIEDLVFGDGRLVYRLAADVHTLSLDLTRSVARSSSLILGYELQATRARGGIDYERNQIRLSYLYVF